MIMLTMPTQMAAQKLYKTLQTNFPDTFILYDQAQRLAFKDKMILATIDQQNIQDIQMAAPEAIQVSRIWHPADTIIETPHSKIGGANFNLIAGPDSIESTNHVQAMAKVVKQAGGSILRGGSFKPRTNPYSFQGYGEKGLAAHRLAADQTQMDMMTEIMDPRDFALIDQYTDIFQVGARNMQNFSLLKQLGQQNKPVGLKRGMSATIDDLLNAAEYILAAGNPNVFLIERGIRTFDHEYTRNTLDIAAIPVLKRLSHLPILVDPSHAAGQSDLVAPLALAAVAAGAQGLMIEIHDQPKQALVDGKQALTTDALMHLMDQVMGIRKTLKEI